MYVLLGSNGQITSKLAALLLAAGHPVRVVGRSADSLAPLAKAGAEVAVGDVADCRVPGARLRRRARRLHDDSSVLRGARHARGAGSHRRSHRAGAVQGAGPTRREPVQHGSGAVARHRSGRGACTPRNSGFRLCAASTCCTCGQARSCRTCCPRRRRWQRPAFFLAWRHRTPQSRWSPPGTSRPLLRASWRRLGIAASCCCTRPGTSPCVKRPPRWARRSANPGWPTSSPRRPRARRQLRAHGFSASAADQIEVLARWLSTSPLGSARVAPVEVQPTTIEVFAREQFEPAHARLAVGVA